MKKQWYISVTAFKGGKNMIQYVGTKKEAEQLKKVIDQTNKVNYTIVDFVWKSDIEKKVPFSQLHGRNYKKVDNILELLHVEIAA